MKALLQQALDALEYNLGSLMAGVTYDKTEQAINALRAAIAQGESEPVAWMVYFDARLGGARITDKLLVWTEKAAKEQVKEDLIQKIVPLYTAPQVADCVQIIQELK